MLNLLGVIGCFYAMCFLVSAFVQAYENRRKITSYLDVFHYIYLALLITWMSGLLKG